MGLEPGTVRIIPKEKVGVAHISTHGIPVSVLINYLEQSIKKVIFIGIQPDTMSGEMTEAVKQGSDELIKFFESKRFNNIQKL